MSPDDQLAASGGDKGEIVMREIEEGGRVGHSIDASGNSGHGYDGVLSLCFSPDGEKLACTVGNMVGTPGVITVYDVESGELVLEPIKGHKHVVFCVLWSLDGSQLRSRHSTTIPSSVKTPTRGNQLEIHGLVTLTRWSLFRCPKMHALAALGEPRAHQHPTTLWDHHEFRAVSCHGLSAA
ncbi:hypothetical protein BDN67DRAFT_1028965 [Paxillus ammoniavirescens]|nr:hypothetical protein BDN67DRAFT_1028965 [Paxillus ammoniavirescens]